MSSLQAKLTQETHSVWPARCSFRSVQCLPTLRKQEIAHKILASSLSNADPVIGLDSHVAPGAGFTEQKKLLEDKGFALFDLVSSAPRTAEGTKGVLNPF